MMRKKQVVLIVSIVLVCFVAGTSVVVSGVNPFDNIWQEIYYLRDRVEILENSTLPEGFMSTPAYDSEWIDIDPGVPITLEHGLDSTEVFVYLTAKNPEGKIHQRRYGGENANTRLQGGYWLNLTESEIVVRRLHDDDTPDHRWEQVRVMIWKIQEPPT